MVPRPRPVPAQRRPGHAPRRHSSHPPSTSSVPPLAQRRPGHAPRRHARTRRDRRRGSHVAQRRPGHAPRRHPFAAGSPTGLSSAQRRPGHAPRRHVLRCVVTRSMLFRAQRRPGHAPRRHVKWTTVARKPTPAQRRPGHAPRRHARTVHEGTDVGARSTKAGARTPATPEGAEADDRAPTPLNEGRGTHPGDTPDLLTERAAEAALNEGRGTHPGDTCSGHDRFVRLNVAQRRPGHAPRRHKTDAEIDAIVGAAQRRPGHAPRRHAIDQDDTLRGFLAQRRPGHAPRRHAQTVQPGARLLVTAQRRPGHAPRRHQVIHEYGDDSRPAQRRPGHAPRRHLDARAGPSPLNSGAQRRPGHAPRRHAVPDEHAAAMHVRSTKAGARTPATRVTLTPTVWTLSPLNEGRGTHPGDTRTGECAVDRLRLRSTKAGARTPATPSDGAISPAAAHAQRRPGHAPRRHPYKSAEWSNRTPLNEGRGTHPGDTHLRPAREGRAPERSTKAGARTPATRLTAPAMMRIATDAQRRPGHAPRRHSLE